MPRQLSRGTHRALERFLDDQRHLSNAALQERIDAWHKYGMSISAYDQFRSLTQVRANDPRYAAVSVDA